MQRILPSLPALSALGRKALRIRCFRGKSPFGLPAINKFLTFLLHCNKNVLSDRLSSL
jgi:hypothetical protein